MSQVVTYVKSGSLNFNLLGERAAMCLAVHPPKGFPFLVRGPKGASTHFYSFYQVSALARGQTGSG